MDHWDIVVFESKDVNAFALPGGKIGVYTGILKVTQNADQLAAALLQKDPLSAGVAATDRYNTLATNLLAARDKDHGGIVTNFDQLSGVEGVIKHAALSRRAS